MEPFTIGMLVLGGTGASLIGIAFLEKYGVSITEDLLAITMTVTKFGGIVYLLKYLSSLFF
ncbi:hypothetical protein [Peribacillus kribbensis]|uniref:hypothetical protein n=1 Tax=Peribacillus kribbensis TaxID=356658 RepID=UPI0003F8C19B|nr:hypothetical protein [Peribacillus kribbensis]